MVIFAVLYGQMQNLTQQNLTQLIQTLIYEKESKANFIPLRWTFRFAQENKILLDKSLEEFMVKTPSRKVIKLAFDSFS